MKGKFSSTQVPAAAHDGEELSEGRALRGAIHCPTAKVALMPIKLIRQTAGIGQPGHHQPLPRSEVGLCVRHHDRLPARRALRLVMDWTPAGIAFGGVALTGRTWP